jgi:catechol 1,2-dioxygenase
MLGLSASLELTTSKVEACNLIVEAGQASSAARNEVVLCTDVLGIESLVDTLDHVRSTKHAQANAAKPTSTAVLGPFYRVRFSWSC